MAPKTFEPPIVDTTGSPASFWQWLRSSERIVVVYFLYTTVLSIFLHLPFSIRLRTWIVNAAIIGAYVWISRRQSHAWNVARDWIPAALLLMAYKQIGWFAPPVHDFRLEKQWIVWDRLLLRDWGGRALIEAIPGLPALLELSYLLVYAVPAFAVAAFYVMHLRQRVDAMLTIYALGLLLAYGQFPFWPSEPPRAVFPGEDAPLVNNLIRRLNLALVGGYGIHTSVFPSAHVSGAYAAAFAFWILAGKRRVLQVSFSVYATLVAVATVYGRYHYAVDAVAGLAVAVAAVWLGSRILRHQS